MGAPPVERRKKVQVGPRDRRKRPRDPNTKRSNIERRQTPPVQRVPRLILAAVRKIESIQMLLNNSVLKAEKDAEQKDAVIAGLKGQTERVQEAMKQKNKALMLAAQMLLDAARGDAGLSAAMMRRTSEELRKEACLWHRP